MVAGMLFSSSTKDYGFFSSKIGEEFEYSDKIAGIGFPHIVQRTFTAAELLLERAEAKLMMGDIDGGADDLCMYWNSAYTHFSDKTRQTYVKEWSDLVAKNIPTFYSNSATKKFPNCFDNWDFTKTVDPTYVVPANVVPYMNCLNEFRRFENMFEGLRFFDLKRWGMPYVHEMGSQKEVYTMQSIDTRRAIEVPWEALSAGLESSREVEASKMSLTLDKKSFVVNNNE